MTTKYFPTIFCLFLCFALTCPTAARGAAHVDPFLESFRVGALRPASEVAMDGSWPAGLWAAPLRNDAWLAAAGEFFEPSEIPSTVSLMTWRFLETAAPTPEEGHRWYRDCRDRVKELAEVSGRASSVDEIVSTSDGGFARGYQLGHSLAENVFTSVAHGDTTAALRFVRDLLTRAESLRLSPEEIFIWRLRRMSLEGARASDLEIPWSYGSNLGPWDSQSAWQLWVACRTADGAPLLSKGSGSDRLAHHLTAVAGPDLRLDDLARCGFSDEAMAALGAVVLPKGGRLAAHFRVFSTPPKNESFQRKWLDGRRRMSGYTADITLDLSKIPGLARENRLDLLRRASEAFVIRGDWQKGLDVFGVAYDEVFDGGTGSSQKRYAEWAGQLMAWCAAANHRVEIEALLERVVDPPGGPSGDILATEADTWRKRLREDSGLDETGDRLQRSMSLVRQGRAGRLQFETALTGGALEEIQQELELELWHLWAKWGRGLFNESAPAYARSLEPVSAATNAAAALDAAAAAAGRRLGTAAWRETVLETLLEYDYRRISEGVVDPPESPFPSLARRVNKSGPNALLELHSLLAVALATGDGRGIMSLTMVIPQGSLTLDERLLFLYPLPKEGRLLEALAGQNVEVALMLATARNESGFEPATRSRAGALGWLQIMPFHYPDKGFSGGRILWRDPTASLDVGAALVRENRRRYSGDPYRSVAAYNAGGTAVDRWDRQLPTEADGAVFLSWIGYPETRRYVEKVLIDREIYDWILQRHERSMN